MFRVALSILNTEKCNLQKEKSEEEFLNKVQNLNNILSLDILENSFKLSLSRKNLHEAAEAYKVDLVRYRNTHNKKVDFFN